MNDPQAANDEPVSAGDRELIEAARRQVPPGSGREAATAEPLPVHSIPGYEIIREIHRGGQGVVYQAIQKSTRRKVAVKIMREGPFAGSRGKARFEREVQVLAQLNHPNIVNIHESGEAAGNFYFVMDYISGHSLEAYMSARERSIEETLRLSVKICDAVNAAHLHGVIHRDLKPSNIRIDASGQPHVLDFGLAKIAVGELTDESRPQVMSLTGQFIGSLPWASPEQAEGSPDNIDLRTDVYSLGVIIYQMLTGRLPYEVAGNMRDVLDNIMHAEPARPSTVRRQINNEVETMVLKCLSKDQERRYQSAGELGRDIQHYLAGEPIEAKRDSGWYVVTKTLRRYRAPVAVAALIVLVVTAAMIVCAAFWHRAALQRDRALVAEQRAEQSAREASLYADFLDSTLTSLDPNVARGLDTTLMGEVLDEASRRAEAELTELPEVAAAVRDTIGRTYLVLGSYDEAQDHLQSALSIRRELFGERHPEVAASLVSLAELHQARGRHTDAERLLQQALAMRRQLLGEDHLDVADCLDRLAWALKEQARYTEAEETYGQALDLRRRLVGEEHLLVASSLNNLAQLFFKVHDYEQAEAFHRQALDLRLKLLGTEHTDVATSQSCLASVLACLGKLDQAEVLHRRAVETRGKLLGVEHPAYAVSLNKLALLLERQGDYAEAESLNRQALAIRRRRLGDNHHHVAVSRINLARVLKEQGRVGEAQSCMSEALRIQRGALGEKHPDYALGLINLAELLYTTGDYAQAERHCREALAIRKQVRPEDPRSVAKSLLLLGRILVDQGDPAAAEPYLREGREICRQTDSAGHWVVAYTESLLGNCLTGLARFDEAEPLLTGAYPRLKDALGAENTRTREALQNIIHLYESWDKPEKADEWRILLPAEDDAE